MTNKDMVMVYRILMGFVLLVGGPVLYSQDTGGGGLPDTGDIEILHADNLLYELDRGTYIHRMIGRVKLLHDSTFLLCDSAIMRGNHVTALGNVIIIQGDSTRVFSDTLLYDGDIHESDLYGQVVLQDKHQKLFTSQLHYNLQNKVGTYERSAVLTDSTTFLQSKSGKYFVDSQYVYFYDDVKVLDTSFTLYADSLLYRTEEQKAYFLGPTVIDLDSSSIYCEGGWYDFNTSDALFMGQASYQKGEQLSNADTIAYLHSAGLFTLMGQASLVDPEKRATAQWIQYSQKTEDIVLKGNARYLAPDKSVDAAEIFYNLKTEELRTEGDSRLIEGSRVISAMRFDYDPVLQMRVAEGEVVLRDTAEKYELHCDRAVYDERSDYMKSTGIRPWMLQYTDGDSLYIAADTFLSFQDPLKDSTRTLRAWRKVQIYGNEMQGVCDSLVSYEMDSTFTLFNHPILWSDTSQFTGDTIRIFMKNKSVHRVEQRMNAFIITTEDEVLFNQLKGRLITTIFEDQSPFESKVTGNAEVVYYLVDDNGGYIAANKTVCSDMTIRFAGQKVDQIRFYKQPKGEMIPMKDPSASSLRLSGFDWNPDDRPTSYTMIIAPPEGGRANAKQ